MAPFGRHLEELCWFVCSEGIFPGVGVSLRVPSLRGAANAKGGRPVLLRRAAACGSPADVEKVLENLQEDGFAAVDGFIAPQRLSQYCGPDAAAGGAMSVLGLRQVALQLDGRPPEESGFLSVEAASLLEGRMPPQHPRAGSVPPSLFGAPGPAPLGQVPSCLSSSQHQKAATWAVPDAYGGSGSGIRRSWLGGTSGGGIDVLGVQLEAFSRSLDALVSELRDFPAADDAASAKAATALRCALFRDHVMVARHDGRLVQGSLDLPYDSDTVLGGRHPDWRGDAVLTAVSFLDEGCAICLPKPESRETGDARVVKAQPGRLLLYWSRNASFHSILGTAAGDSLCLLVRYFDGAKSLLSPPGMEHLYRHCNPVWPAERFEALRQIAHDDHHAKRVALISDFFEVVSGDKLEPGALDEWLADNGYCVQCGRVLAQAHGGILPRAEFGGKRTCSGCLGTWHLAASLHVRAEDGAAYPGFNVSDQDRHAVRQCVGDPDVWAMELRHGALAAPETLPLPVAGAACIPVPCPLSALGECGDTNCATYRSRTPAARPEFLDAAVSHISALRSTSAYTPPQDLVLSFLGSGQLYFEFLLLERVLALGGVHVTSVHLVDTAYGAPQAWTAERMPVVAEHAAIAQFAAWFSQTHVFVHPSLDAWTERALPPGAPMPPGPTGCDGTAGAQGGAGEGRAAHVVLAVDAANVVCEWEKTLRPRLESVLPAGSLFMHLTQSKDAKPSCARAPGSPHREVEFVWSEVHEVRPAHGRRRRFERRERREWIAKDRRGGIARHP